LTGFDTNKSRIDELKNHQDKNNDVHLDDLKILNNHSMLTSSKSDIKDCDIFIVTVPTPINEDKTPDLDPLITSSKLIGSILNKGSIVVYESTVYPGVTDDVCTPILQNESSLIFNQDFSTGYSPERIVPGDKINTIEKIKKIVSGSNPEALEVIAYLYSSIIDAGIHKAPSIKVAEAAKVTENIQRDVNIALINELHQLYSSLDINTNDVIEAASTKWNFMKLNPGLVGGHCISIDPYYLMHKSEMSGYTPAIMRSARKVNDEMGQWVCKSFLEFCKKNDVDLNIVKVTFLGYSFKENCSDVRNTKVEELILLIKELGISVSLWDPLVDLEDLLFLKENGVKIYKDKPKSIELGFLCVAHDEIKSYLDTCNATIFDYKNINH
jgi:UDP-N-acetyl-D-galactosamine dehydrogenase